jgi:hypothetical protein
VTIDLPSFEPTFDFESDERSILLHQGEAEVCIDGDIYEGPAEVRLDFEPRACIALYGHLQGLGPINRLRWYVPDMKVISSFSLDGRQLEGFGLPWLGAADAEDFTIRWSPASEPVNGLGDDASLMTSLVFHLFNFVGFWGIRRSTAQVGAGITTIMHVDLRCDDWSIELKSLPSTSENIKFLKNRGGYRLTHVGRVQTPEGAPFSGADARNVLNALTQFLSFANGGPCNLTCPTGFDASGNRVWEQWSAPRDRWYRPESWFDPHTESQLEALFPCFMEKCADDGWRDALDEAIYWYLGANHSARGMIDGRIILTQAALERLSNECQARGELSDVAKQFKEKWASAGFRRLFVSMGIPIDIPKQMETLRRLASKAPTEWDDAPHALTDIRNSFVHPENKCRGHLQNAIPEAWRLGLWFLELSILAICGYSGTYSNRLKHRMAGTIEHVPWKT